MPPRRPGQCNKLEHPQKSPDRAGGALRRAPAPCRHCHLQATAPALRWHRQLRLQGTAPGSCGLTTGSFSPPCAPGRKESILWDDKNTRHAAKGVFRSVYFAADSGAAAGSCSGSRWSLQEHHPLVTTIGVRSVSAHLHHTATALGQPPGRDTTCQD